MNKGKIRGSEKFIKYVETGEQTFAKTASVQGSMWGCDIGAGSS